MYFILKKELRILSEKTNGFCAIYLNFLMLEIYSDLLFLLVYLFHYTFALKGFVKYDIFSKYVIITEKYVLSV